MIVNFMGKFLDPSKVYWVSMYTYAGRYKLEIEIGTKTKYIDLGIKKERALELSREFIELLEKSGIEVGWQKPE